MHALSPSRFPVTLLVVTAAAALQFPAHAEGDPFAENVRTTAPLPPAEQVKTFHLPPGFEIDLVASEPQLAKPMNMAFDARGRLWFTTSYEYPFPKKPGEPARDQIKVLEDTDHDGRYDKVTTFAEGLNIPIAILPYGEGCLAWSIPNIYYFRDTDGDGKADRQDVIFGPLGWERDTHGNIASFRRGNDGWIYGTHGFNNNSTFKGRDGSTITVNSGNTYRFRPDGSRIEQYTWGQVNPFGMCFDERGYLYTADCHSSPIYQLIPGGYYPSFGKPDDGLGFSPTTIQHSHGSTAIAGILIVPEEGWPEDLRGNIFIGNVMTSRINRDRIEWRGSSPVGHEMPDFLSTDDPWFRPVDIQLGPDGALYVADFYNRIIGHYEVPLTHPGRDRERGRIWRIRYTGPGAVRGDLPDLTRMATPALMEQLASGNPVRRSLALNELVERPGMEAATLARQALTRSAAPAALKVGALWVLERTARVDGDLVRAAAGDSSPLVRQHAMRVIGSLSQPSPAGLSTLVRALQDPDPHVRRSAAEALAQHPSPTHLAPLLAALAKVPDQDTHLAHAIRISLRDQLRADGAFEEVTRSFQDEATWHTLAEVAIAVPTPESSRFLTTHVQRHRETPALLTRILKHASRYAGPEQFPGLMEIARKTQADLGQQLELLQAMRQGIAERGQPLPPTLRAWATDLAVGILKSAAEGSAGWQSLGIEGMKESASPWIFQERPRSRGGSSTLLSSLPPGGEALTGMLQSPEFTLPARLSFDLSGHDGYPDKPAQGRNHVRLREAGTGAILADAPPPRNDASRRIEWDLSKHAGKRGRVEVIDADTGDAYAWLAVGGFEPPIAGWPSIAPRDLADRVKSVTELADLTDLSLAAPALRELAINASTDLAIASAAARLLSAPGRAEGLPTLGVLAADPLLPAQSRRQLCGALAASDLARCDGILVEVLSQVSWRAQTRVAEVLAGHPRLAASLVDWVDQAKASPRLLREAAVKGKLESTLPAAVDRIRRLAAAAPEANADLQRLIDTRRAGYAPGKSDPARGAAVFAQTCAVCHKIEGTGNLVGPQLDGIGNRGIDRLCEDILDPNRNVDHAFRTHLIVQTDGEVVSGLPRREEGDSLVLANSAGQEFVVSKKSIKERRESANSLMPENFGEILSPADFNHLLAFLMSQAARARQ